MAATTKDATRAGAVPGSLLVVIHDFKARSADELSLAKGDRIELIEKDDDFNDGWFLGRHIVTGTTGLFPEVYTTLAAKAPTVQGATSLRRTSGSMPSAVQAQEASSTQRPASASTFSTTAQRPTSSASSFTKPTAARSSLPGTSTDNKTISLASSQSPVMHETLTVIDEHMNDMAPSATIRNATRRDTMGSMYSSHPNRMSYIAGHETEDEEGQAYTEAEITKWSSDQVAEYLEDHGVEKAHCQVFREQEITGEVLLAMDQSSVFLKEFDLGAVGRRLRTWHKIKALQDEAQRNTSATAPQKRAPPVLHELEATEPIRDRSASASVAGAPKIVAPLRSSTGLAQPSAPTSPNLSRTNSGASPLLSAPKQSDPYRPSAQNVRTMQHWRHSSRDSSIHSMDGSMQGHRKHSSTDQRLANQANGKPGHHSYNASIETTPYLSKEAVFASPTLSPVDLDKGYFSSTEAESRTRKSNVLQKRQGSTTGSNHSRSGSFIASFRRSNPPASSDSLSEMVSPLSSPNLQAKTGGARTISMPTYGNKTMSSLNESTPPMVTKLEPASPRSARTSQLSNAGTPSTEQTTPVTGSRLPFFSKTSKIPGMRALSEAVTRQEKTTVKDGEVSSPTKDGMRTPSTEAASFDMKSGRTSAGSAAAVVAPPQPTPRRAKAKTKKSTSAYTKGLEKKSPAEQMIDCDYSGWMKKKSGSLMTTWKPRLFVLRGRRLSYYYSESDTEEKGLIDISFHNVMPAMDERLTSVHAAVTGAGGAQPNDSDLTTTAQQQLADNPPLPGLEDDGLFIFKLTPPKAGRGVNFTKPTVHYFAVNSRQEGRLWMAALMKAVIARDVDSVVQTTYNQATISLAKARARKERPPALQDDDAPSEYSSKTGLGIDVLRTNGSATLGSVDGTDRSYLTEDNSSLAASSVPTAAPSIITDLGDIERDKLAQVLQ